jgi:hypothetical protein
MIYHRRMMEATLRRLRSRQKLPDTSAIDGMKAPPHNFTGEKPEDRPATAEEFRGAGEGLT